MTTPPTVTEPKRRLHGLTLFFLSLGIVNLGWVMDQTIRWTDHLEGLESALIQALPMSLGWSFSLLLWIVLVLSLYHWRRWQRFRSQWSLAPAILIFLLFVAMLVMDPPTAAVRFRKFAKTELPKDARALQFHLSGGGFADYSDIYYFETSPSEVDRLIRELGLKEENRALQMPSLVEQGARDMKGPDPKAWKEPCMYERFDEKRGWFYDLVVDASKTRVYINVGCI